MSKKFNEYLEATEDEQLELPIGTLDEDDIFDLAASVGEFGLKRLMASNVGRELIDNLFGDSEFEKFVEDFIDRMPSTFSNKLTKSLTKDRLMIDAITKKAKQLSPTTRLTQKDIENVIEAITKNEVMIASAIVEKLSSS